jgi:hypothetical protein
MFSTPQPPPAGEILVRDCTILKNNPVLLVIKTLRGFDENPEGFLVKSPEVLSKTPRGF